MNPLDVIRNRLCYWVITNHFKKQAVSNYIVLDLRELKGNGLSVSLFIVLSFFQTKNEILIINDLQNCLVSNFIVRLHLL